MLSHCTAVQDFYDFHHLINSPIAIGLLNSPSDIQKKRELTNAKTILFIAGLAISASSIKRSELSDSENAPTLQ